MAVYLAPKRNPLGGTSLDFTFQDQALTLKDIQLRIDPINTLDTVQTQQLTDLNVSLNTFNNSLTSNINTVSSTVSTLTSDVNTQFSSVVTEATRINNALIVATDVANTAYTSVLGKQPVLDGDNKLDNSFIVGYNGKPDLFQNVYAIEQSVATKNDVIDSNNKLEIGNVDLNGHSLEHIDISSGLQSQLNTINNNISLNITEIATKNDVIDVNNKLAIGNVNLAGSALVFCDISAPLQSQLTGINNNISANGTLISTNITNIAQLVSADTIHDGLISQNTADILTKNNIIDGSNLLDATLVNTVGDILLSNKLTSIDAAVNTKHDVIDTNNKLAIANVDISSSALSHVDITAPLQLQITGINNAISTLQGFDTGATVSFTAIENDITDLQNDKQNNIDVSNTISTDVMKLPDNTVLTTKLTALTDSIATIQALDSGQTTSLNNLNNSVTTINTTLGNVANDIALLQGEDVTLQNNINLKHNVIDVNNKLAIANINLIGSSLSHIDITNPLQAQITGINNSLTALQSYDSSQTATNSTLSGDISALQTSKHNLIDVNNKLPSAFLNLTGSPLEHIDITNPLQAQLTTLTTNNATNSSSITTLISADTTLQNNINLKHNVIDVNNKLGIANVNLTGSSLEHIDITTPLQSQLTTITNNNSTNTSDIATNVTNINLKSNISNPVFTTKIETPLIKLTTGASNGYYLISDANGDASWSVPPTSGVSSITYNAGLLETTITNTTILGTLEFGDASQQTTAFTTAKNSAISTNTADIASNVNNINLKSNISNPVFTTKIETPLIKITTGATDGHVLTSNSAGDASWVAPAGGGGGLVSTMVTNLNTTSGVYTMADNSQEILTKDYTFTSASYSSNPHFRDDPTLKITAFCEDTTNSIVYYALNKSPQWSDKYGMDNKTGCVWKFDKTTNAHTYLENSPTKTVKCMTFYNWGANNAILMGGDFTRLSGVSGTIVNRIAQFNCDSQLFVNFGTGVGADGIVNCIQYSFFNQAPYPRFFIGGDFSSIDGISSTSKIAYYYFETNAVTGRNSSTTDGQVVAFAWRPISNQGYFFCIYEPYTAGVGTTFNNLALTDNGTSYLVAINSWNIASWTVFTNHCTSGKINDLIYDPTAGRLVIGGDFTMDNAVKNLVWCNIDAATCNQDTIYPTDGTEITGLFSSGGTVYMTGNNMYHGLSDGSYPNKGCVYTLTGSTWGYLPSNSYTEGSGKIMYSSSNELWISSSMLINKFTKDYFDIVYNSKTICRLFENDSVMVSTVFDGTNRYYQFRRLTGIKN